MIRDRFGFLHSTRSVEAADAFAEASLGVLAHRPEASAALAAAERADPLSPAVHALKGLGAVILGRAELAPAACAALAAAEASADAGDERATADESALIAALRRAIPGDLAVAGQILAERVVAAPVAPLIAKLSQALSFMAGDAAGMRSLTDAVAPRWDPESLGYGFVLGLHAFALEETGDLSEAEAFGRRATALERSDAWGAHAVAHVCETEGRAEDGIDWIEARRPEWSRCNNFAFHMAWHLALCRLERGEIAACLDLYDTEIRPAPSEDFRDIANAASLLWRLRSEGAALGDRWEELRAIALRRRADATLAFATLHHLLSLLATGERAAVESLIAALEEEATGAGGRAAAAAVAARLARVIAELDTFSDPLLAARLGAALPRLGGSHVQRDVFLRALVERASRNGDLCVVAELMTLRRRLKRDDRFAARVSAGVG